MKKRISLHKKEDMRFFCAKNRKCSLRLVYIVKKY